MWTASVRLIHLCELEVSSIGLNYNPFNNFLIIACGARRTRSCATAYLLTGAQHQLRAGIVRVDRELFHEIMVNKERKKDNSSKKEI